MQKQSSSSPILVKYLKAYEQNPNSRVFAPLAETYRKMGMNDKAMSILRNGIKSNPDYVLGYLGLSSCYFDQGQFQLAYSTLRPFVTTNRDNLRLQKLFGETCYKIGHLDEALETFKYILFINPRDKEAQNYVKELEDKVMKEKGPIAESSEAFFDDDQDYFEITDLTPRPVGKEEIKWIQQDLTEKEQTEETPKEDSPVITHTLVDLYCAQGYYDKSLELLEQLKQINPKDLRTINKIEEVKKLKLEQEPVARDEGRSDLMAAFDKTIGQDKTTKIQKKFDAFLSAVKSRSQKEL